MRIVRARIGQRRIGMCHAFAITGRLCSVRLSLRRHQERIPGNDEIRGTLRCFRHLLGNLRQTPDRRHQAFTGIFVQRTGKQSKQRGLARTIAADQANLLAGVNDGRSFVEYPPGATP